MSHREWNVTMSFSLTTIMCPFLSFSPINRTVLPLFFSHFSTPNPFSFTHARRERERERETASERACMSLCQILSTWLNKRKNCNIPQKYYLATTGWWMWHLYPEHHPPPPPHDDTPLTQAQTDMTSFIFHDNKMVQSMKDMWGKRVWHTRCVWVHIQVQP